MVIGDICFEEKNKYTGWDGQETGCLLLWEDMDDKYKITLTSNVKSIRPLELIDYIFGDYVVVTKFDDRIEAMILKTFANVLIFEGDMAGFEGILSSKIHDYYYKCKWIYASEYGRDKKEEILNYPKYFKKHIPWAVIKTTQIVPYGEKMLVKSLENESGVVITASEDVYIMIGVRGEVYDISREKFEKTYEMTDEDLDIFAMMTDYLPEVTALEGGEFISLDDKAKLCYPLKGNGIFARKLTVRTKVFGNYGNGDYFLGNAGDYLAIRCDDLSDIYIIQNKIFVDTYEEMT